MACTAKADIAQGEDIQLALNLHYKVQWEIDRRALCTKLAAWVKWPNVD